MWPAPARDASRSRSDEQQPLANTARSGVVLESRELGTKPTPHYPNGRYDRRVVSPNRPTLTAGGQHLCHFYSKKRDLVATAGRLLVETLRVGGIAVAAAPPVHLRALERDLRRSGVDLEAVRAAGSYVTFNTKPMVPRLMIDGKLDRDQGDAVLGEILEPLMRSDTRPRFLYGEIAPLLWNAGKIDAALELEARAHELVAEVDVTVMCGYRVRSLAGVNPGSVRELCRNHSYLTSLPFSV